MQEVYDIKLILKFYDIKSIYLILHDKGIREEKKKICYTHI